MTALSMHTASIPAFQKMLKNLHALLGKANQHASDKKIDPAVLLAMRLAPDMFALVRQVQIACDFAKGSVARLAGVEVPKYEDKETTFAELQARIDKTLAFIGGFDAASFQGAETRSITIPVAGNPTNFIGLPYLIEFALPNFYFHMTTAYAILRHAGVPLGKRDFLGAV